MDKEKDFSILLSLRKFPEIARQFASEADISELNYNKWRLKKSQEEALKNLRQAPKPSGLVKLEGFEGEYTWHPRTDDFGDYIVVEQGGEIKRIGFRNPHERQNEKINNTKGA